MVEKTIAAETLVLNALLAINEHSSVLDPDSKTVVDNACHRAVTSDEYKAIEKASAAARAALNENEEPDADTIRTLRSVASMTLDKLVDQGVKVEVEHKARLGLSSNDAVLYTFSTTRDPSVLDQLSLPASVRTPVSSGISQISNNNYEKAATTFKNAIGRSTDTDAEVETRVLAALAYHWAGADNQAVKLVEEATHLNTRSFTPHLAGIAADHRQPKKFRSGKLGVRAFLRYTIEMPKNCTMDPTIGYGTNPNKWLSLNGTAECRPINQFKSQTWIRLNLQGQLPHFPNVKGYYVALGVIDLETLEIRKVKELVLSGPESAESQESIRFKP